MITSHTFSQVKQLLVDDPTTSEYADMERELNEVIFVWRHFPPLLLGHMHLVLSEGSRLLLSNVWALAKYLFEKLSQRLL